jgi:hypothetical protein
VTCLEHARYWVPALNRLTEEQFSWEVSEELDSLLECNEFYHYCRRNHQDDTPMPEDIKQKLLILAGPYGLVYKRVLEIRKKDKDERCDTTLD